MLEEQLTDEEEHAAYLESQLELIRQVGLENYLARSRLARSLHSVD